MKVCLDDGGEKRLIGRADVPDEHGPALEVPLFGPASIIAERFTIGTVTHLPPNGGPPMVERAVLLEPGQLAEVLPGWQPLAS